MKREEMPIGFSLALAQNPEAMQKFFALSEEKRREIISGTHSIQSRKEMQGYVNHILSAY